ncbi:hypothetical protein KKI23_03155, partial [Patescibacteria group bacterium]|nr:hypothetical protein [Patescibacteria group bacterium]
TVTFTTNWSARMPNPNEGETGPWEPWNLNTFGINAEMSPPKDIGNGRIHFPMPMLGFGVIFPKGGSKLDPAKVPGLQV